MKGREIVGALMMITSAASIESEGPAMIIAALIGLAGAAILYASTKMEADRNPM